MSWEDYKVGFRKRNGLLIGLNGVARSGKDTVGDYLVERYGFKKLWFAEALRKGLYDINPIIAYELGKVKPVGYFTSMMTRQEVKELRLQEVINDIGWEEAKVQYTEVRELMQRYGTEGGRDIHGEDCWTNIIKRTIEQNSGQHYVICDVRFPNEIELVRILGGTNAQIQREGFTSVNGHVSDKMLEEWNFDEIIKNNGSLEDLYGKVDAMMKELNPFKDSAGTQSLGKFA